MPDDPRREPSADTRAAARSLREMYIALTREGFNEREALQIIGLVLSARSGPPDPTGS